jgi:hypothetical protein
MMFLALLATETDLPSILPLLLFAPSLKDSILHETNIRRWSIVLNGRQVGLLVAGILFHSRNHSTHSSGFVNRFLFSLLAAAFLSSRTWVAMAPCRLGTWQETERNLS